ncbi:MAG: hypothetical protein QXW10_03185, partial [Candidatus Micrarchaeaceae archaeon]
IKKLYGELKSGSRDAKEVTEMMYSIDLAYEVSARYEIKEGEPIKDVKDAVDVAVLRKAYKIDRTLMGWITDESQYEYKKLLKELKELSDKERAQLYMLLRNKERIVVKPPDEVAPTTGGASVSTSSEEATASEKNTTANKPLLSNPDEAGQFLRRNK